MPNRVIRHHVMQASLRIYFTIRFRREQSAFETADASFWNITSPLAQKRKKEKTMNQNLIRIIFCHMTFQKSRKAKSILVLLHQFNLSGTKPELCQLCQWISAACMINGPPKAMKRKKLFLMRKTNLSGFMCRWATFTDMNEALLQCSFFLKPLFVLHLSYANHSGGT